ncbi:MAG: 1,3-beta-galactosyl-N-acetylhexosamine phosphorylase [Hydrogenoanaerobacterium sp.]
MKHTTGRVTVPTDADFAEQTVKIMKRWGADAVRDCDGTKLPAEIAKYAEKVYTTYFLTRGDQNWAKEHPEELQELYVMSRFNTAFAAALDINIMDGFFAQQLSPDTLHDPKKWWEVIDRTTGELVPTEKWSYNAESGLVSLKDITPYHEYTVSFLVYAIWDPTQMYNHITNNWGDKPHEMPYDARLPRTQEHILQVLEQWLSENPTTNVVRFTTFFYHFTLVFNSLAKEKFVDWFGYSASVSPACLEAFEKEKGYALRPEDIIDEGYYNSAFRVPSKKYLDFLDFQNKFVCEFAAKCVDMVHKSGKEAMMFLGDNWIGTEPYSEHFAKLNMDAVVGSVGGGTTLRLISEIPNVKYTEGRFLPYFFPDTFHEGGNPVGEAKENWLTSRRAILRKPVDRIGYGGYMQLAAQFPDFIAYIEQVCEEFRTLYDNIGGTKPYVAPFKVAVLNCWGKLRSWSTHMVAHSLWYKQIYSYLGVLEALSGMAFDVSFISFDDIRKDPQLLSGFGAVINAGDAETAFSGGENWADSTITGAVRAFVAKGGGFVGIGQPSAHLKQGHFFQLAGVLGVDEELGFSLSTDKYNKTEHKHFILEGNGKELDFGEGMKNIYALDGTEVIVNRGGDIQLAVNSFGKGRSVYISGLPYSHKNARLLYRSLFWAAGHENELHRWFSQNPATECNAYPERNLYCVVNNTEEPQETTVYKGDGGSIWLELKPCEVHWAKIDPIK